MREEFNCPGCGCWTPIADRRGDRCIGCAERAENAGYPKQPETLPEGADVKASLNNFGLADAKLAEEAKLIKPLIGRRDRDGNIIDPAGVQMRVGGTPVFKHGKCIGKLKEWKETNRGSGWIAVIALHDGTLVEDFGPMGDDGGFLVPPAVSEAMDELLKMSGTTLTYPIYAEKVVYDPVRDQVLVDGKPVKEESIATVWGSISALDAATSKSLLEEQRAGIERAAGAPPAIVGGYREPGNYAAKVQTATEQYQGPGRVKLLAISAELLPELLRTNTEQRHMDGTGFRLSGMPDDGEIVDVWFSRNTDRIIFKVKSETFEVIGPDQVIPELFIRSDHIPRRLKLEGPSPLAAVGKTLAAVEMMEKAVCSQFARGSIPPKEPQ